MPLVFHSDLGVDPTAEAEVTKVRLPPFLPLRFLPISWPTPPFSHLHFGHSSTKRPLPIWSELREYHGTRTATPLKAY